MLSLRAYTETLCGHFDTTRDAMYERQRLLVRAGLLELEGRGPGGGSKATARNVALLVISQMATDNVSQGADHVRRISVSQRHPKAYAKSPLPSVTNFLDCLELIFSSPALARHTLEVEISRTSAHQMVRFRGPLKALENSVVCNLPKGETALRFSGTPALSPSYHIAAHLEDERIHNIALDLKQAEES